MERRGKETSKTVDLRPAIFECRIENERVLLQLGIGDGGYARPDEVASLLPQGLRYPPNGMPFHRREMFRLEPDGRRIDPMDI